MMRNKLLPRDFILGVQVNCGKGRGGRDGKKIRMENYISWGQ